MSLCPLAQVAERLRREAAGDGELLDGFLAGRDGAAFAVLVRRHGPMVRGVCRRVLRDANDADDAFQATFLVLLRKAGTIRPRDRVGPWLCGVAYRCASKARSLAMKRRSREQPLADRPDHAEPTFDRREWLPLLDAEINRLPEKYRAALVLCDLEGRSRRDAAARLRLSEGTLSSRLARARALLGGRLKRRGVTLSAALLALSEAASAAVPPELLAATCAVESAAPATVSELTRGVLRTMAVTKVLKVAGAALLVAGLSVGLGLRGVAPEARADKPAAEKPAAEKPAKPVADKPAKPEKPAAAPSVSGAVVSVDAGKKTVTVLTRPDPSTKETKEETFKLADGVAVVLEHGVKKGETKAGTIENVTARAPVTLELNADKSAVTKIRAGGGSLHGYVKSADAAKNAITVGYKDSNGAQEKTVTLEAEAKISLDDGLGSKDKTKPKPPPKEGKFTDLAEGAPVAVQLSGYDRTQAVRVTVSGPSYNGVVTGVDVGNNTITLSIKGEGEKTFPIHKEVRVNGDGKLADVANGVGASVRLSAEDQKTVVAINTKQ
jgi:RNA polymerase sigma factor (sigma-70 family)